MPTEVAKLSADVTAADTTIPVDNLDAFPDFGKIQIEQEIITYSGKQMPSGGTGTTEGDLLNAFRGADGTTPAAHEKGTPVLLFPTAGGGFQDNDGCSITTNDSNSRAWLLIIPAVGLLVIRRRPRWTTSPTAPRGS